LAGLALVGIALAATAGDALAHRSGATPLGLPACSPIQNPGGNLLVVSDLPLHGATRAQATQMTQAIAFELGRFGWKAGNQTLAYQSCDDSTAATGAWDAQTCTSNAGSYAADQSVVAVIGALNSGCTQLELPVANRAPNGPLAMISPANTWVGLTHRGPGTGANEPAEYYPTGKRNFTRVIAANDYQGAAAAVLARDLGVKRLYLLSDTTAYGKGIAGSTASAAKTLGIAVAGSAGWDPKAAPYTALAAKVAHSGAQAVFLGGLVSNGGGTLIQDLRSAAPNVTILAPDGFAPVSDVVQLAGGYADGMYVTVAGLPVDRLPRAGRRFVTAFEQSENTLSVDPYAVYAAEAVDVVVAAIAASDGTRSDIGSRLFDVRIRHGLLGPVGFDANGDLTSNPISVYKVVAGKAVGYRVITPGAPLVHG
jgi:branched-chain amino acid transport system substrate-binding protein